MFAPFSSDQIARLRINAQLLVAQTSTHQEVVDSLVAAAELELREAEAARLEDPAVTNVRQLLSSHAHRSAAEAEQLRRLSRNAHAQHGAACRLLASCQATGRDHSIAVLVVDDYFELREHVARTLRDAGFAVRTAANGLEGLIAANDMRPVVIVMDVAMPVLDGIEATRLIKANDSTRDAKVIAYTSNTRLADTLTPHLFSAVLEKRATPAAVVAAVQHVASL